MKRLLNIESNSIKKRRAEKNAPVLCIIIRILMPVYDILFIKFDFIPNERLFLTQYVLTIRLHYAFLNKSSISVKWFNIT